MRFIEERSIKCLPLKIILSKHMPGNQKIDFITIDVEGNNFDVLKSNDWEKFRPKVIIIEDDDLSLQNSNTKIHRFLNEIDYQLFSFTGLTSIYKDCIH
ncbi:MAG: FkbM family methyltransferase [Candidatus Magasanikbacteria bacterium]